MLAKCNRAVSALSALQGEHAHGGGQHTGRSPSWEWAILECKMESLVPSGVQLTKASLPWPGTQRKKGEEVEAYPECFAFSKKIMEGLKSVHL
eukprot:scaffold29583_cov19-Tisochrysis_lutea.AAC.5